MFERLDAQKHATKETILNTCALRPHRRLTYILCTTMLIAPCTLAQSSTAPKASPAAPFCTPATTPEKEPPPIQASPFPPCPVKHHRETTLSLGVNPELTVNRVQDIPSSGIAIVGTAPTAGVLGTFRQTFGPWLGYSANFGYSRVAEHFFNDAQGIGLDPHGESNVGTNMYEYSLTYVIHTRVNKRFSIFADAGLGGLTFVPTQKQYNLYPADQNLPTGIFGSGADLHLSRHLDVRAEYRGLFYKSPHLFSYPTSLTLTSEPTLSLVYNFTHPKP
jgi:hypothetical protein